MAFLNDTQTVFSIGQQSRVSANVPASGQSIDATVPSAVTLNSFSPGSLFSNDPDTQTIMALESGSYILSCGFCFLGSISDGCMVECWLEYNNFSDTPLYQFGLAVKAPASALNYINLPFTASIRMNAGDTVRLMVRQSGPSSLFVMGLPQTTDPAKAGMDTHITFTRIGP